MSYTCGVTTYTYAQSKRQIIEFYESHSNFKYNSILTVIINVKSLFFFSKPQHCLAYARGFNAYVA